MTSDNPDGPGVRADATDGDVSPPERAPRSNIPWVGVSSVVAAGSGYAIFLISARVLPVDQNADFLAFWGVLFGLFGVLTGLMHEATRAAKAASLSPTSTRPGARIVLTSVLIGGLGAALLALGAPWWVPAFVPDSSPALALGLVVATVLYAGHVGTAGTLGGRGFWGSYSGLAGGEAMLRLSVVVAAALLGFGLHGLELAAISGTVVWLLFVFLTPQGRLALRQRADVGTRKYFKRCGYSMASAASSAVLITGFPALIKLLSDEIEFAAAAPLLLAVSLTRAPILIPLQAFQGVVMTRLMGVDQPAHRVLGKPIAIVLTVGVAGGLLATWLGPVIMLIFGSGYSLNGWWIGLLTFDASLLAVLTLTGTASLAASRHRIYLTGWVTATVVSVGVLALPGPIDLTVVCSLAAGPLVGSAVHVLGLRAAHPASSPSNS